MKKLILFLFFLFVISCTKDIEEPVMFTLTSTVNPAEGGSVSPANGQYESGDVATISATPAAEYVFEKWTGGATGTSSSISLTMTGNKSVVANFIKKQYPLTIEIEGEGTVTETVIKQGLATDYNSGTIVELTAVPKDGWEFLEWSGDLTGSENPVQITIDKAKNVTAVFEIDDIAVFSNETMVVAENVSDIRFLDPTLADVTGYTHYSSPSKDNFLLFFGNIYGEFQFNYGSINDVDPAPSVVLKKVDNKWGFHKVFYESEFWVARNFKVLDNYITVGDGSELGNDPRNWGADLWVAQILDNGDLDWNRVNNDSTRGFFHGTTAGDLNGDGLQDVGGTPGVDHEGINIFFKNSSGSYDRNDEILNFEGDTPFTLDFHDFDKDGIAEIVTADYGGGGTPDSDDHEIRVYKYNNSTNKFELNFKENEPNFYSWGKGATSIICADLNNDNHDEIIVAREDGNRGFEVWLNNGDETFSPHFSHEFENLDFQEFKVFDANNDGYNDILLNGYGYKTDFRIYAEQWNIDDSRGVKINKLIWLNNGDGTFSYYNTKDLTFEGPTPYFLHPYLDDGVLHFFGVYHKQEYNQENNGLKAYTWDFKIDITN
jgi:uncharacterized repeat protein (TIGR02543 family)